MPKHKGIIVTGMDTGVGKTVVAAGLARALLQQNINVGVMKPIATGALQQGKKWVSEDVLFLRDGIASTTDYTLMNPSLLKTPLSPNIAFRLERKKLLLKTIFRAYELLLKKHDFLVVEGLGGLATPLTEQYFFYDLVKALHLPLLIVTTLRLGSLNHTLLTTSLAESKILPVKGFVLNNLKPDDSKTGYGPYKKLFLSTLEEICHLPVLTEIPYFEALSPSTLPTDPFHPLLKVV